MYIAVRQDLPSGAQLAQVAHAAFQFSLEWHSLTAAWNGDSNNVVIVAVPDEAALADIAAQAVQEGIVRTIIREPDLGNTITAIALQPGADARRICARLPLAGRILVPG